RNGSKEGQFIGGVVGDEKRFKRDSDLVRLGTFNAKQTPAQRDPENGRLPAWAQAEMFFDCGGAWTSKDCNNDDDDAMWHFKWRPRLRRFNQPIDETLQTLSGRLGFTPPRNGPEAFARQLAEDARAPGSGFHSNQALRNNLAELINDDATRTHGVH
ncbi:MAG TPA: hypothetical protein VLT33_10850, partial [Labilithrix sp.]|nr:hypothetical protein [Labilithrix sp.]